MEPDTWRCDKPGRGRRGPADTPAQAVEGAEVVITALFGSDAVQDVVIRGRLPLKPGTTWVDITTVSRAEANAFAAWAAERGIHYAHSPVIGSLAPPARASSGCV